MAQQYGCGPCRCHHSRGPQQRGQNQKWLPHPCLLGGPKEGGCYVKPAFSGIPNKGNKIRSGYPTPAFSGVTSKIWHIPNAQGALKTQLWNNKPLKMSGLSPPLPPLLVPTTMPPKERGQHTQHDMDLCNIFCNSCKCVLCDTMIWSCMMSKFCVKETYLAMMAFVALFAP